MEVHPGGGGGGHNVPWDRVKGELNVEMKLCQQLGLAIEFIWH